jgi:HEAT repeat protein
MARSASPDVREAVARVWRHRPDLSDQAALGGLTLDPSASVRREVAGAVVRTQRWDLLERMLEDPDAAVRREVAVALGRAGRAERRGRAALEQLAADPQPEVRAAAYVGRLLQGTPAPFPPGLDRRSGADAVITMANLGALREAARTSPSEDRRLAAALALALLSDEVAREVARTDPVPAIRHRVSGALELTEAEPAGVPA